MAKDWKQHEYLQQIGSNLRSTEGSYWQNTHTHIHIDVCIHTSMLIVE